MKSIVPIVLHSERLILRPPVPEDAEAIESFISDRRVAEMTALIPHPYPKGSCIHWVHLSEQQWIEGKKASFVICLRDSGELVGAISIFNDSDRHNEVGYWIGVPHWGQGYATEAFRRVIRYAFEDLDFPVIVTYHFIHNPASGRVMQKAGLLYLGTTPLGASRGDQCFDEVRYGIAAGQWRTNLATI
ncbi:GNAT family N-acetyltransferase [Luteolibacter luteus]|uniref:GNAT family N-acetyltransferase n=1 Tax=Luteolibacter luteus TaxID=2728835 RepID=A0A858RNU8_9BACT|nr:GNAT family N-acetyltransferase [Luteolibacter luteus]QJE97613.1 GNAT family N-acetyltransferase [Luteolibacter luteus]